MKKLYIMLMCSVAGRSACAQIDSLSKARFVVGLSAPELLHLGAAVDLGKSNQFGIAAGIGPSWGTVWPTLNLEHRFYLGRASEFTNRRRWFLKQGVTYFPAGDEGAITLTIGADLNSKARNKGWTIDAGLFRLFPDKDRYRNIGPALRFQHYVYFQKAGKR